MARPSKIDPALAERIASSRAPNPARLLDELRASGVAISGRTLRRHLAKAAPVRPGTWAGFAPPEPRTRDLADEAAGALEGSDVDRLVRARDAIEQGMALWRPSLGTDPRAVRAYATLSRALGDLAAKLAELNPPPPPDPEHDPANVAAKARLLSLVDEVLARDA